MMVAAVSETTTRNQTTRPPLLPSEKDNGISITTPNKSIRHKPRQVSSRYLSPSPSTSSNSNSISNSNSSSLPTLRRSPSPLISRNSTTPAPKRSVSADRRRPIRADLTLKPNNAGGGAGETLSAATKLLVTSTRSLSVSFQGEAFSLPISKTKVTPQSPNSNTVRKGTPERKRTPTPTPMRTTVDGGGGDHLENTKPIDHHRWPGRIRQANVTVLSKSLSLDCGVEKSKINSSGNVIRPSSHQSNLDFEHSIDLLNHFQQNPDGNSFKDSDTDSVSSGSTSGIQENRSRIGPRGIIVSPKFWQETNSRIRRLQDPSSPLSTSPKSKLITPQKLSISKKFLPESSPLSSPRTMASPNRMRPSSPSKFIASPRTPGSKISSNFSETPSVLSFAVDVRRGKVGENRFFDAHLLRILYNRQLQWRFVNARSEDIVLKQKHSVEENLWNAWITISDLRDSVTKKRHRLQLLRQKLKLASILKAQIIFLEDWGYLDKDHSISLLGAIEALKASTLRLPVGEGASADLQSINDAINSALDLIQAMGSSTRSLCLQVEEVNVMAAELAKVAAKERALLRICKDFLSILSTLKVKDCSLRTHMLQTCRA
ncbi:QWRF motif-containing protein 2 [Lactuca sativa]|uniref:Uncharacterized protein n=1 Tax=Lactuca sativa TaxID=4236 RepID=A0A9R1V1A3_LACSA|nr:QWRF motif-containing protein 2 [Lactuca sativa]KAJ0197885.1 hypothetical protein LSAT_V11C700375610 [Lactuca sativa]